VPREALTRFYRDWYRPNLMAVIVAGDVDRDAVVTMIKSHFSALTNPSPARPRPAFDVPDHPGTRYAVVTDKETTETQVELTDLRPARNQGSVGGYREVMMDQLFGGMLSTRLDELTQRENPPFIKAAADRSLFPMPRTKDEAVIQALVSNDGAARGLEALVTELQRVARFGFTATELARAKQSMMAGYERVVTESPDRESASRADEYTRNFLQGEALPTIWQELAFHRRFVPEITLREVNALTGDWFPDQNRFVIVAGPDAAGLVLADQAQLEAAVKTAAAKRLEPYVDAGAGQALMDAPPPRGAIVKTTARPDGITEWTLSNGATVVLKPTTLKEDQILFRATAPGGTSLASEAGFIAARAADDVIPAGGVGKFDGIMLDKILAGKAVAVTPFIGEIEEGMGGGSTPPDLETMFQLIYLRFTQPRADPTAFAAMASQAKGLLANRIASPDVVFNQTIDAALSGSSPRRQPETPATVDKWNLAASLAFYKARFADASHFTFVFAGSFTPETIKPLVETYLASLPATHAQETWRDLGIAAPAGVVEKTIEMGIAPKSQVAIIFSGSFEYDAAHIQALRTMTLLLQSRLFDSIRQELGGTYSITATPSAVKFPRPQYSVRIEWTCDPARTATLVQRVFEEIETLKGSYIAREQMGRIRQGLVREYELDSQENGYFLNQIARRYADGDVAGATSVPDQIAALTGPAIQQAAQTYLNTSRYVKVTLMPAR
jgi:zinc protease